MSCLGDCLELGPPPDTILFMPPPPAPSFVLADFFNTTPCLAAQICDAAGWAKTNKLPVEQEDYIELPRKDIEAWSVSGMDDTWLLVLVASSIGVLLLGALLAMFLLKCREMNMFGSNDCSLRDHHHHQMKIDSRDCSSMANFSTTTKVVHPSETVLYHGSTPVQDNRMVWAALTPRGTQHFISENYPRDLIDYGEQEDHYETIDHLNIQPTYHHTTGGGGCQKGLKKVEVASEKSSFDNSAFVDYDYEDPTPLIESYQLNTMENYETPHYHIIGNTDMRCAPIMSSQASVNNTLRRPMPISRPQVSSPTRIEHPNLPPLNLYPHKGTLKKNTLSYRNVDAGTLPKYGGM